MKFLKFGIALVWLVNGLFCKVLNVVPRHRLIVARILGERYSVPATVTIGILEILMFVWILSGKYPRLCAIEQMLLIGAMNIIEFTLAPDLLLFGRKNILVAGIFILIVFYSEFGKSIKEKKTEY